MSDDTQLRIDEHPILRALSSPSIPFTFNGIELSARKNEVISSALYANGIAIFGHHFKDHGPQGIFCVNGQCSQCLVIADGRPVKACMTPVKAGMQIQSAEGHPDLPEDSSSYPFAEIPVEHTTVLIIGGGPAGISAAIELGRLEIDCIVVDDKPELGGKLSLQTHNFFGSVADCWAGTRGINIGHLLEDQLAQLDQVQVWLESTALGVFVDGMVGVLRSDQYMLVKPDVILIASGAREKSLSFPGCDLPRVYGAGAFQTLVNRDRIRAADKLFVVGGGNVGLIGAYHALQAGIDVVGLVEALPHCGGYKVHEDKLRRLGVPVWTSHTVKEVWGTESVEGITICQIDDHFRPLAGTEKSFAVDTVLVAVGLASVNELYEKAKSYGMTVYAAGDAAEIAEASAAIFSGRIVGRAIAQDLGRQIEIPATWQPLAQILKSRPGTIQAWQEPPDDLAVYPIIRCVQPIPCNPCVEACPKALVAMPGSIMELPVFVGTQENPCIGCGRCVATCPGLAITLLFNDYDPTGARALLMVPFEFNRAVARVNQSVTTVDMEGNPVGTGRIVAFKEHPDQDSRRLILLEVPAEHKLKVAGFRIREQADAPEIETPAMADEDPMVCRCERVRQSEILQAIKAGVRDLNQLKVITRSGMGGCNGKTCTDLIMRLFRQEGIRLDEITPGTQRPITAETPLGLFAGEEG